MEQPQVKTDYPTIIIFLSMMVATVVGVPLFGYFYGYSAVDWAMFVVLYLITGLGITVGYHRLISHRSFECKPWVKACLLVAADGRLKTPPCAGARIIFDIMRAATGRRSYNAKKGFWYSHCGWLFIKSPYRDEKYEKQLRKDPLIMWQHRYYIPVVLSGLALPFIVGFFYGGWMSGLSCFILAGVGRTFFVLNSTFCINSICHMWGEQPHGTGDSSRDSRWISLITFWRGLPQLSRHVPAGSSKRRRVVSL